MDTEEAHRIAHEVNNALAIIGTLSELLLEGRGPDDPERSDIEGIRAAAERAAAAVRRLEGRLHPDSSVALTKDEHRSLSRRTASATLLLVEPDAPLRGTIRRLLAGEGFDVIDASSWDEATGLVTGAGLAVDAILSRSRGPDGGPERAIPRVPLPHDLGTALQGGEGRERILSLLGPVVRAGKESVS